MGTRSHKPFRRFETFKINVERFPESANVYDSLGDAYYTAGKSDLALENYQRAYRMTEGTQHPSADSYRAKYQQLKPALGRGALIRGRGGSCQGSAIRGR